MDPLAQVLSIYCYGVQASAGGYHVYFESQAQRLKKSSVVLSFLSSAHSPHRRRCRLMRCEPVSDAAFLVELGEQIVDSISHPSTPNPLVRLSVAESERIRDGTTSSVKGELDAFFLTLAQRVAVIE